MNRAILFSQYNHDWSCKLEKAETLMNNPPDLKKADINCLIELYTIKEQFDNEHFLPKWTYWQKAYYEMLVDIAFIVTQEYFFAIDQRVIDESLDKLDPKNVEGFWKLFSYFGLHARVNRFVLSRLMFKYPEHKKYILQVNQEN